MKIQSKLAALTTGFTVLAMAVFGLSPVFADSPGQLLSGSNFYVVKNITQSGSYGASASAACNEEVQYSIDLHNGAFGGLTSLVVNATLPSGAASTSTATATPAEGASAGASGSVTVNGVSNGNLVYENGTTTLYNGSGAVIRTLPDTITTSGVNVGNLAGSTVEFVNFKAKVSCPAPVTPAKPIVTPAAVTKSTALPNTGPGDVAELFVGASGLGAVGHYVVNRRRRN